jgi:arabinofuranosyltransferase
MLGVGERRLFPYAILSVVLVLTWYVTWRIAWLCDDALITLHQVFRWVHGAGITWNAGERVQAFSHPLWFLLCAAGAWASGGLYKVALGVSLLLSGFAFLLVAAWAVWLRKPGVGVAALLCMLGMLPLMEYTSSGLETPLAYFLGVLVVLGVLVEGEEGLTEEVKRLARWVCTVAAAGFVLTRFDLGVMLAPMFLGWIRRERWRGLFRVGMVLLPMGLWLAFSLFYFGLLFPCTYYAKLSSDFGLSAYIRQGLRYFYVEAVKHPFTWVVLVLGIVSGWRLGDRGGRWAAAGIVFYLVYLLRIGGDWMLGRMFTVPGLWACILAGRYFGEPQRWRAGAALGLIASASFMFQTLPTLTPYYEDMSEWCGVMNNRGGFASPYGLHSAFRHGWPLPEPATNATPREAVVNGICGYAGIALPDTVYHVDPIGLCSPMVALMPAAPAQEFRVGHIVRCAPNGLAESILQTGGERWLGVPELEPLFHDVMMASRAPLWDVRRIGAVVRLNLMRARYPKYKADGRDPLHMSFFVPQGLVLRSYAVASRSIAPPENYFKDGFYTTFGSDGLRVRWDVPVAVGRLQFRTDTDMPLRVRLIREDTPVKEVTTPCVIYIPQEAEGLRAVKRYYLVKSGKIPRSEEFGSALSFVHTYRWATADVIDTVEFVPQTPIVRVDLAYLHAEAEGRVEEDVAVTEAVVVVGYHGLPRPRTVFRHR